MSKSEYLTKRGWVQGVHSVRDHEEPNGGIVYRREPHPDRWRRVDMPVYSAPECCEEMFVTLDEAMIDQRARDAAEERACVGAAIARAAALVCDSDSIHARDAVKRAADLAAAEWRSRFTAPDGDGEEG